MAQSITLREISNVRLGRGGQAIIVATGGDGADIEIAIPVAAIPKVAIPLLCIGSMDAAGQWNEGTVVTGCFLPVMNWGTGRIAVNQEPTLRLHVSGGSVLQFQMPSQAAIECGRGLQEEGVAAAPPPQTRPN